MGRAGPLRSLEFATIRDSFEVRDPTEHMAENDAVSLLKTLEEAELAFDINYCTALELIVAVQELLEATPELRDAAELTELVRLNRKQQAGVDRAPILL